MHIYTTRKYRVSLRFRKSKDRFFRIYGINILHCGGASPRFYGLHLFVKVTWAPISVKDFLVDLIAFFDKGVISDK